MNKVGKFRGITKNLLLMGTSILVFLVIAEIMVRLFWFDSAKDATAHRRFCRYSPTLGWEKIPNKKGRFRRKEFNTHMEINSKGLRDHEYPYEKPENVFRILVLGDSFTEGYAVELEEIFANILEKNLNAKGGKYKYEVINGGTGGYSVDQEYLFYLNEGRKYNPDLIFLVFCDNDIYYTTQATYVIYPKPYFTLEGDRLILKNVPVPKTFFKKRENKTPPSSSPSEKKSLGEKFKEIIHRHCSLYNFVGRRIRYGNPRLAKFFIKLGLMGNWQNPTAPKTVGRSQNTPPPIPDEFLVYERVYQERIQKAWDVTRKILQNLNREAKKIGAPVVLFHIPTSIALDPKQWEATKAKYQIDETNWDPDRIDNLLRQASGEIGIHFMESQQAFIEKRKRDDTPLNYENDGHWNVEGNLFAAQLMEDYLRKNQLLQ